MSQPEPYFRPDVDNQPLISLKCQVTAVCVKVGIAPILANTHVSHISAHLFPSNCPPQQDIVPAPCWHQWLTPTLAL